MKGKYTLVETTCQDTGLTSVNHESPFKDYLYETAIEFDKTDITDREKFDRTIDIYKKLKEATYLCPENIDICLNDTGETVTLTLDEAKMIVDAMEQRVVDLDELIDTVRQKIKDMKREPRIVVYTCITGGYDNLAAPSVVTPGVDYVCFTDNMSMKSKVWKLREMPEELKAYSNVKQQRGVKILAHRYLPEYDISVWVDGAVIVRGNIKDYLKTLDFDKYSVFIPEHPVRKCIYAEKDACIKAKKIKGDEIALAEKQMKRYKEEGFPVNYGLVQTNVMMRKHNDQYCKDLMEKWWDELKDNSHRDQLSFNYAVWKCGSNKFKPLIKTTCNSKTFNWIKSHRKKG